MNFIKLAPKKNSIQKIQKVSSLHRMHTPGKILFVKTREDRFPSWKFHHCFSFFIFSAPGNIIILVSEIISLFLQLDPLPNQICSDDGSEIEYTASAGGNLPPSTFAFVHKSHFRPLGSQITAHARAFFCRKFEDYFTDCLIIR